MIRIKSSSIFLIESAEEGLSPVTARLPKRAVSNYGLPRANLRYYARLNLSG